MPQAAAQDQWEDVTPRIAPGISPSNKNSASGQLTPGNVDLAKQPRVKNADGSVSTVDSHSYGIDGKEVLLPSVTADGRHLMKDEEILSEYKKTGRHLGMFDTPENATAYAKQLHNDYAAGKYGGADEWEDVVPQQKPPAQAGAPAKPGFFRTMAQDIGSMVKPLVGAGGVQIEDPEQFRKKYEAMNPEQQAAQRAETQSNIRAMPTSDINSRESTNYAERRNAGQSPVRAVAETSYEAGAGANMTGFDEAARQGNTAEALGHLAAPVALGAATHGLTKIPEAPEAIRSATHEIRDSVGKLVRTDTGELKPLVHAASRVGGGIVGGGIGAATGIPYAGYGGLALGGAVGPEVADAILPNRPAPLGVAPTEPSAGEFYENRAQDLTRRGKEQASIDRTATRNAPKPAPDPVAEAVKNRTAAWLPTKVKTATPGVVPAEVGAPTISDVSSIKGKGEPRTSGSEGRPATWTNEAVLKAAAEGNRDAISQVILRKLPMPENARYIMGDPDYPRAVLNPREVTRFNPDGTPIRNQSNPKATELGPRKTTEKKAGP